MTALISNTPAQQKTFNSLHKDQQALQFPEQGRIILVISGDFGAGKTSFISGLLAGTDLPASEKRVVINDLATPGGAIDLTRFQELQGISRDAIEACSCCDAQTELIQKINQSEERFVVLETGGLTNGGQAVWALANNKTHKEDKIIHVTLVDAEMFETRKRLGALTVTDLNIQTADTVVITKAGNKENLSSVIQYLKETLSNVKQPKIFATSEPYLIENDLWQKGVLEHSSPTNIAQVSGIENLELEKKRQYLLQNTKAVKIQLYDHLVKNIAESISPEDLSNGKDIVKVTQAFGAYYSELNRFLGKLESDSSLESNSLKERIIRIKGEIPITIGNVENESIQSQYGLDIFIINGSPEVKVVRRANITTDVALVAFYTFTNEPYPQWFSPLGIPAEFTLGESENLEASYEKAKNEQLVKIANKMPLQTRADIDSTFELLELTFLDVWEGLNKNESSAYQFQITSNRHKDSAESIVIDRFTKNLASYLDFRVSVLEELKRTGHTQPNVVLAFGFDLIITAATYQKTLLSADALKEISTLNSVWQRAQSLKFGTMTVLDGLAKSDFFRVRGRQELDNEMIKHIVYAMWYLKKENQGLANFPEIRGNALLALKKLTENAVEKNFLGWTEENIHKLTRLCLENTNI